MKLRIKYRLGLADYDRMFTAQSGACAACGRPEKVIRNGKVARLAVDHDHTTGAVRALLCAACNLALGQLGDSAERIRRLLAYKERFDAGCS